MFVNKEICSACGGKCCKDIPGCYYPEDFNMENGYSKLKEALKTGKIAIDWWEGDPREGKDEYTRGYFVRPATKWMEGVLYDPSWGGECIFLTNSGCQLEEDKRPLNCRKLEPGADKCIPHDGVSKRDAAIAWLPYYDFLDNC